MSDIKRTGAVYLRSGMVVLTEAETVRMNKYVTRVGAIGKAMAALGLSNGTFDAARGFGRMMTTTRERVLDALARVGA